MIDRKTSVPPVINVPHACISVTGGIQPGTLRLALGQKHRDSGLAARLLVSNPPRKRKQWTEADIDPALERDIAKLFDRIYELQPEVDEEGFLKPVLVNMTPSAKQAYVAFFNGNGREQYELTGDLAAAWSKLEEYAARLALIVHCIRWAYGDLAFDGSEDRLIDEKSMAAGITLTEWFKGEAKRVYEMLAASKADEDASQLAAWVQGRGGSVTAREVQQGNRQFKTAEEAEDALDELVHRGQGVWKPSASGQRGQPTRRFIVF